MSAYDIRLASALARRCALLNSGEPIGSEFVSSAIPGDVASVRQSGAALHICLRGSKTREQWLQNFRQSYDPTRALWRNAPVRGGVHTGFSLAAIAYKTALRHELIKATDKCGGTLPCIILAGHSRGGGIAPILARILEDDGFSIHGVYTFDAPRTGDAAWADFYDAVLGPRTFRHVLCADMVSRLPSVLHGYRHVGQLFYFDRRGRLHRNAARRPFWDRVIATAKHIGRPGLRAANDHGIKDFIPLLDAEAARENNR